MVKIFRPRSQRSAPSRRAPQRKSIFFRPKAKRPTVKKPLYRTRYIVDKIPDTGRRRRLRTFNDPHLAKNFVERQKYRHPEADYKIRPEKEVKKLW